VSVPFHFPTLPTLHRGFLRVAAFAGFAPFAWRSGGRAQGRDIDFLRSFAAAHGLKLVVDFHDFARLWELPANGEADIAASGISLRPFIPVAWTRPYSEVRRTLLIRAEEAESLRGMHDLGRLAVVPHSAAHFHAEENLPAGASLSFTPTLERGIKDLLLGQIDALGTGSVSADHHAAKNPGLARVDVHGGRRPEWIAFATRPPLVRALDAFIVARGAIY
jgi:ABC-type amino acid transport substrate-binding protein